MAGSIQNNDHGESAPLSDINVTPFVDVVLVLLVIFMITAPALMRDSIGIQLPKANSSDSNNAPKSMGVAVNSQGQVLLNGSPLSLEELSFRVVEELKTNPEIQAIISADKETKHGDVVKVIDTVKQAGLKKFAIQIQKERAP